MTRLPKDMKNPIPYDLDEGLHTKGSWIQFLHEELQRIEEFSRIAAQYDSEWHGILATELERRKAFLLRIMR